MYTVMVGTCPLFTLTHTVGDFSMQNHKHHTCNLFTKLFQPLKKESCGKSPKATCPCILQGLLLLQLPHALSHPPASLHLAMTAIPDFLFKHCPSDFPTKKFCFNNVIHS